MLPEITVSRLLKSWRDTAGELSHRLQALRLAQGLLDARTLADLPVQLGIRLGEFAGPCLDPGLEGFVERAQVSLGALTLGPGLSLGKRAHDGARQAVETLLGDVVRGPTFQGLDRHVLAEGPRDEHEGNRGALCPGDAEGAEAVEGRQDVIGQDQVVPAARDRLGEGRLRHDPVEAVGMSEVIEHRAEKLRVEVAVLQKQDPQRRRAEPFARAGLPRAVSHEFDGQPPPRCGGGSFSTAQNTPSSWIASKNSVNPTGFTTKAFTPRS